MKNTQKIILASSSPFRKALLNKLNINFETISPDINEDALENESPNDLVIRLALEKAKEIAKSENDALIIGSDQVAVLNGKIIGKPGNHKNATIQLKNASGNKVTFFTGLCLYNSLTKTHQVKSVPFTVFFRELSKDEIESYLSIEKPYNCAGSFKSEGLGISLFSKFEGSDPNALIGLPLIELISMLKIEGVNIL